MTETTTPAVAAPTPRRALITGASGYIGSLLLKALMANPGDFDVVVATDIRDVPSEKRLEGVTYLTLDVRSPELAEVIEAHQIDSVVHLATIVTPSPGMSRETMYEIDVVGTQNLLDACTKHGVKKLIVTSSGAAYGYHPDNSALLREDDPLRGHETFAYSHHKRLVEEMLARHAESHPELEQLILRPGTILGESARNQITNLFEKSAILGIKGIATPFCFIWDQDVVACLLIGLHSDATGIYNLSGDGVLTLREIATLLGKRYVPLSASALETSLRVLHGVSLTQYGPEQLDFLRYRPVLGNEKLKHVFGYRPQMTSREVFDFFREHHPDLRSPGDELRRSAGKVVAITGAATGIGEALARRFAEEGARLALLDIDATKLEETASALEVSGYDVLPITCDVRDEAQCVAAIDQIIAQWGGVDVLINNAGISHMSPLISTDTAVIRRVMAVNFFGAVHCTRAALESIIERRGVLVAISSVAGFAPLIRRTGYAASKHALHGFFNSLRAELRDVGVGVTLVCPSFTDTQIAQNALSGGGKRRGEGRAHAGKLLTPAEVADAVVEGVMKRREQIVLSPVGKASYWLSRLLPRVYEAAMRHAQREL